MQSWRYMGMAGNVALKSSKVSLENQTWDREIQNIERKVAPVNMSTHYGKMKSIKQVYLLLPFIFCPCSTNDHGHVVYLPHWV